MAGRPNHIERFLLDFAASASPPVIDLRRDEQAIREAARLQGLDDFSLRGAIDRLEAKGHFHRVQRFIYIARARPSRTPRLWSLDPVVAAALQHLDMEYYVSWHAALWYHGLLDQQSRTICVATERPKRPVHMDRSTIRFVPSVARRFYGWDVVDDLEWPVRMATASRALVDAFDKPRLVGPAGVVVEALRRAWEDQKVTPEDLIDSAIRFGSPVLNRRIGYFMDHIGMPDLEQLELRLGRRHAVTLFPGPDPKPGSMPVHPRWRVYEDPSIIAMAEGLK